MIELMLSNGKSVQSEEFIETANGVILVQGEQLFVYPWHSINFYKADKYHLFRFEPEAEGTAN